MPGEWVGAGFVGVVGILLVIRWTKSGKAPATALKCLNCPKLVERIRQLTVLAVVLFIAEVVTLGWWAYSAVPH